MMLGQAPQWQMPATAAPSGAVASTSAAMHPVAGMEGYHNLHTSSNSAQAMSAATSSQFDQPQQQRLPVRRKRKADTQDANNERLNKRMSLLNLEQNGARLYVPVEQPQPQQQHHGQPPPPPVPTLGASDVGAPMIEEEEPMQLDDTKHKVYIYNLDDELSSDNESEPGDRDGRLAFLPDIEKHLRLNRMPVPKPILPNRDGELAGMQMVLYSDGPSSITVPEEKDSVRKAVLEARARVRQRQAEERGETNRTPAKNISREPAKVSFATPVKFSQQAYADLMMDANPGQSSASAATTGPGNNISVLDHDPDAMDLD